MTGTTMSQPRSGLVTGPRWALVALAGLFTLGAFAQFFLVGISYFDNPVRWKDHADLGNVLGLLTYIIWIPAVLGRAGMRVILGSFLLFVLFMAQHAFMEIDNSMVNALHPLNGSILLVLGFWITMRAFALARGEDETEPRPERTA